MLEQLRAEFSGKNVLLLGYGLEGRASHHFLKKVPDLKAIGIADSREKLECDEDLPLHLGDSYLDACSDYDLILKSPGISLTSQFWKTHREKLTSQTELFLKHYPGVSIGITGTKGKTTTSSLIHHIFREAKKETVLLGNIGRPIFEALDELSGDEIVVLELSSHQLQNIRFTPRAAVLLNLYPEHLEYYESFKAYRDAKYSILQSTTEGDLAFINESFEEELPASLLKREVHWISSRVTPPDLNPALSGPHHKENVAFAIGVAERFGISIETIESAISSFTLPPHRGEEIGEHHGITWINDSASTIPQATIAALRAFPETDTVIVGGFDRGVDLAPLVDHLKEESSLNVICIPETGEFLKEEIPQAILCDGLEDAVSKAQEITRKGGTCLFSPSAASYHLYKSYGERGEHFRELVEESN